MQITTELIKQVANNACLELSEEEITQFTQDFKDILAHFETLEKATVSEKPSFHPIPIKNNYREDVPSEPISIKDALRNVKDSTDEGHIRGPKVV